MGTSTIKYVYQSCKSLYNALDWIYIVYPTITMHAIKLIQSISGDRPVIHELVAPLHVVILHPEKTEINWNVDLDCALTNGNPNKNCYNQWRSWSNANWKRKKSHRSGFPLAVMQSFFAWLIAPNLLMYGVVWIKVLFQNKENKIPRLMPMAVFVLDIFHISRCDLTDCTQAVKFCCRCMYSWRNSGT